LNRRHVALTAAILIALIALSLFLAVNWFSNKTAGRQFYVGVEYAYGENQTTQMQVAQIHSLVDKVKGYTNLFVMGSLGLTFNQTALTEACDYVFHAKLNFIVLFTGLNKYNYSITEWMTNARSRYGEQFLGIDRYDEPGGNQLDTGAFQLIDRTILGNNATYGDAAKAYVANLTVFPNYYLNFSHKVFTADYALEWFDYKANYSCIFAEFVGNESRQRIVALDRGAAEVFGRDWGVIVTWKYSQAPYLESGSELYSDLSLAYSAGAKYGIVFSYPNITNYGTLADEHFEVLQKFWNTLHSDPGSFGSNTPEVAYVVPVDYGFGFRNTNDSIWGLFPSDALSQKIFEDTNTTLPTKYGSRFDVLYDEPQVISSLPNNYSQVFYWNQTIP
jgi:hypothetical protein